MGISLKQIIKSRLAFLPGGVRLVGFPSDYTAFEDLEMAMYHYDYTEQAVNITADIEDILQHAFAQG